MIFAVYNSDWANVQLRGRRSTVGTAKQTLPGATVTERYGRERKKKTEKKRGKKVKEKRKKKRQSGGLFARPKVTSETAH